MTAAAVLEMTLAKMAITRTKPLRTHMGSRFELAATNASARKRAPPVCTMAALSARLATVRKIIPASSAFVASRHFMHPVITINTTPASALTEIGSTLNDASATTPASAPDAYRERGFRRVRHIGSRIEDEQLA